MNIDEAVARGIDGEIQARREQALKSKGSTRSHWSDRDVARRLDEVGYPLAHTSISRMRNGQRRISVNEWIHVALALSVPPLELLGDEQLTIGGRVVSADRVRAYASGDQALNSVPDLERYAQSAGRPVREGRSHLTQILRNMADQLDLAGSPEEELELLDAALQTVVGAVRGHMYGRWRGGHTLPKGGK